MIPVQLQPEPEDFADSVRKPGQAFIEKVPFPTTAQWRGREYWQRALPAMRKAYLGICAYSGHWIPPSTGNHSIDHFTPKAQVPQLAYEWHNFRYVAAKFNSRKGMKRIIDPFELLPDWFTIDFRSFLIVPNPILHPEQSDAVLATIACLKLNDDEDLVKERQAWFLSYLQGEISFAHLLRHAPFIGYEVQRQGIEPLSS